MSMQGFARASRATLALLAVVCSHGVGVLAADVPAAATATLRADRPGAKIEREVYGHFAEHLGRGIYEGVWVGEASSIPNTRGFRNDVVAALRKIRVPVVRWPGGCFAEDYDWRDGVGPRDSRPTRVNALWGGVEESNAFGTHEFMEFVELIGAKSYVSVPVGAGSPQAMQQWLEYMVSPSNSTLAKERRHNGRDQPFRLDYIGLGNENWGCGGQMRPEYYADLLRNYLSFVRMPQGQKVGVVAAGPNADDYRWTEVLMADSVQPRGPGARGAFNAIGLHFYTFPNPDFMHKGAATGFPEGEWFSALTQTLRMDEFLTRHAAIMDKYDPQKRVALYVDEWGAWYDQEKGSPPGSLYQQNSLRDALLAAVNFNIFHAHADRVRMANIAQMVNVLQAVILTDKNRMVLTPTYHVFDMYKVFQGATQLPLEIKSSEYRLGAATIPQISGSAAKGADGNTYVALANLDPRRAASLEISLVGSSARSVTGTILTAAAMDSHNTFESPDALRPVAFNGAKQNGQKLVVQLPARSVVVLDLH